MLICPGSLQCLYFNTLYGTPKDKYCLTACVSPKVRLLLINSEPSVLKKSNPEMGACQVSIDAKRHSFLRQDSYIDCTELQSIPEEIVDEQISDKPSRELGKAPDNIIEMVKVAIENSPTIPAQQIEWVLTALASIK